MSGWGVSTPNIGVDHGVASIIYGDGDPLGVPDTIAEIDLPPEPEQVHTHVQITMKDDSLVVVLDGDVLFDFDKFIVKPEADKPLKQAASIIKAARRAGSVVLINGHTDNIGTDDYNQQLSEKRAKAVKQWFVSRNYFTDSTIRTSGFGKSAPKEDNKTEAGRAKNRRVEIFVLNP